MARLIVARPNSDHVSSPFFPHCFWLQVYASPSKRQMDGKGEKEIMAYPNIFFTIDNFDEVSAFTINSCFGRVLYRRTDRHTLLSMQERIWKGGSCWTDCVFTLNLSSQVFTDIVIRDGEVVCVELLARDKSKQFSSVLFIGSIKYEALRWVSNCPRDWQLLRLFWKYWRNEMPFNFLLCFGWSCLNERLIRLSRFVWLECFLSFFFVFFL